MASEFDRVHSVQRALDVGALNCIIPPETLRPYLIDAVRTRDGPDHERKNCRRRRTKARVASLGWGSGLGLFGKE